MELAVAELDALAVLRPGREQHADAAQVALLSPQLEQVVLAHLVEVVGRPPDALHRDEQPDEEAARERDEVLGVHDRRADRGR